MKIQLFVVMGLFLGVFYGADAALTVNNNNQMAYGYNNAGNVGTNFVQQPMTEEDLRNIQILENDIRILDAEIKKCETSKKGWTAATVIGSAGVVATGVSAIVQGVKISNQQKALDQANAEKNRLNTAKKELQDDIKK